MAEIIHAKCNRCDQDTTFENDKCNNCGNIQQVTAPVAEAVVAAPEVQAEVEAETVEAPVAEQPVAPTEEASL